VEEAAESVAPDDLKAGASRVGKRPQWAGLVQGAVGPVPVEVGEDLAQVTFAGDEDPIEDLPAYAARPAFRDRVHGACGTVSLRGSP
jgi:hypothetical protein